MGAGEPPYTLLDWSQPTPDAIQRPISYRKGQALTVEMPDPVEEEPDESTPDEPEEEQGEVIDTPEEADAEAAE